MSRPSHGLSSPARNQRLTTKEAQETDSVWRQRLCHKAQWARSNSCKASATSEYSSSPREENGGLSSQRLEHSRVMRVSHRRQTQPHLRYWEPSLLPQAQGLVHQRLWEITKHIYYIYKYICLYINVIHLGVCERWLSYILCLEYSWHSVCLRIASGSAGLSPCPEPRPFWPVLFCLPGYPSFSCSHTLSFLRRPLELLTGHSSPISLSYCWLTYHRYHSLSGASYLVVN